MFSNITRGTVQHVCRSISRGGLGAPTRSLMTLKSHKVNYFQLQRILQFLDHEQYSAHATAHGQGRNGKVKSDDDIGLELRLAMPKSLGGKGDGQNPEQLFAMGYAACFLSALQMVASQMGKTDMTRNAVIHTQVHLGQPEGMDGFGLEVEIQVEGVQDEELINAGHAACPYSRALKHGASVKVSKV